MSMEIGDWVAAMRADPENAALMGVVSDWLDEQGRPHAAEAMRMLGETRKVGGGIGYVGADGFYTLASDAETVCGDWGVAALGGLPDGPGDAAEERVRLAEAYEAADGDTRLRWATATFGIHGVCR